MLPEKMDSMVFLSFPTGIGAVKTVMTDRIPAVVVGGSIGLASGYLPLVAEYLSQEPAVYQVPLREARYRHDAGLLGAALWGQGATI